MLKLYDTVIVKKNNVKAAIIEIDDNNGKSPPIYLVEVIDKPDNAAVNDVIFWCEESDLNEIE
ncbi:MAG: hypothetical protein ACI4RN_02620 [Oscillospiraceae bacterium]